MKQFILLAGLTLIASLSNAAVSHESVKEILVGSDLLEAAGIPSFVSDSHLGVSIAKVNSEQLEKIHELSHEFSRCGGFELLGSVESNPLGIKLESQIEDAFSILTNLRKVDEAQNSFESLAFIRANRTQFNQKIQEATDLVNPDNLRQTVQWLSQFPTRFHRSQNKNQHVHELKQKLEEMAANAEYPITIDLIDHNNTPQQSLRLHIEGSVHPSEVVVMGGHLDSTVGFFSGNSPAPGADDNASGSANLIEALRILVQQGQPQRSIEIFWYAGEEAGLLGSAEIASSYKANKRDVIGVLQLDMTLVAGSGVFTLGSMSDFTSGWLRELLVELNSNYIGAEVVDSQCGYGCSDHASWHRQGYPALMPFESTMGDINGRIHTPRDIIDERSSFEHSAVFSKIAVAFALELANSTARQL